MSIEEGLARLKMSGHRNSPQYREQVERVRSLMRKFEATTQAYPEILPPAGRDRSGEFQPMTRPTIVRALADTAK
jgi:hypothetical protein